MGVRYMLRLTEVASQSESFVQATVRKTKTSLATNCLIATPRAIRLKCFLLTGRLYWLLDVSNIQYIFRQLTETLQSLRTHAPGMVVRRCLSLSWDKVSLYRTPWPGRPVCTMAM